MGALEATLKLSFMHGRWAISCSARAPLRHAVARGCWWACTHLHPDRCMHALITACPTSPPLRARQVVGHTVQPAGAVSVLCGGQLLMADVGLSQAMGGTAGAVAGLECHAKEVGVGGVCACSGCTCLFVWGGCTSPTCQGGGRLTRWPHRGIS